MSGICGIVRLDGAPADRADLAMMLDGMAHRGPDGSGSWVSGPVGLGHCRLETAPEPDSEQQPAADATGALTIAADVRIDNREELLRRLGRDNASQNAISDARLILFAYDKWGQRCVERFIGDFAFAIWDGRMRELFCARDHFGVKPLVYCRTREAFIFASEVRALLALPQVPRRINEGRVADYFADLEGIDLTSTFYRDLSRLPPASTMTVGSNGATIRSYWSPESAREIKCGSDNEYEEAFLTVFSEAVRCRLGAADRVSSMLSGGMDSSSIVAVARQQFLARGKAPLIALSGRSADPSGCPETRFIDLVVGAGGVEARGVCPEEVDAYRTDLRELLEKTEDLFDFPFTLPQMMYVLARRRGIKAVLDGVDGDLVGSLGSGYLACLLRQGRLSTAVGEAVGLSRFLPYPVSPANLLLSAVRAASVPAGVRRLVRRLRQGKAARGITRDTAINQSFARRIGLTDRLREYDRHAGVSLPGTMRECHRRGLMHPHLSAALERYDRVASCYSVEPRHPFLDVRLVEFALALPWRQKVHRGWSKVILRRATAGILPEEVRWRRGWEHLGDRFTTAWMAAERDAIRTALAEGLEAASDYLDVEKARRMSGLYREGKTEECNEEELWRIFILVQWLSRRAPTTHAGRAGRMP